MLSRAITVVSVLIQVTCGGVILITGLVLMLSLFACEWARKHTGE